MAENYYSTLTSDLAKQYKIKLASKLTAYNPKSIAPFHDLVHLTDEESSDNLERLLSLKRNEVFRREQENALELVGIRRRKKAPRKKKGKRGKKGSRAKRDMRLRRELDEHMNSASLGMGMSRMASSTFGSNIANRDRTSWLGKSTGTPGPARHANLSHKTRIKGDSQFANQRLAEEVF